MLNWIKQAWVRHQIKREMRRERQRYFIVKTVQVDVDWTDATGSASIYYHLEENGYGDRRYKALKTGNYTHALGDPTSYPTYARIVYPWLTRSPGAVKTSLPENARLQPSATHPHD